MEGGGDRDGAMETMKGVGGEGVGGDCDKSGDGLVGGGGSKDKIAD